MSNTNDPLPAIEIAGEGWVSWQPRLYFQRIDDYYGDKEDVWKRMTLAHLVAVLAALTPEQLQAVATHELLEAPISDLAREELQLLRGAQERADRAEQELSEIRAKAETVVHTDDACGLVYFINRDNPQAFWRRKNV